MEHDSIPKHLKQTGKGTNDPVTFADLAALHGVAADAHVEQAPDAGAPAAAGAIDYDKLAAAITRAQGGK